MALFINNNTSRLINSSTISGGNFSVSLWFNRTGAGTPNNELVFGFKETGANDYLDIVINDSFNLLARENGVTAQSIGSITNGTWNHVVANFNTNVSRSISLNGETFIVTPGSTGQDPFASAEEIAMGFNSGTPTSTPFVGQVTLLGIWDTIGGSFNITQSEANSLSSGFSPYLVRNFNMIRYFRLFNNETNSDLFGNDTFTLSGSITNIDGPPIYV